MHQLQLLLNPTLLPILHKTTDSFWGMFLVQKDQYRNLYHPVLIVNTSFVALKTESIL